MPDPRHESRGALLAFLGVALFCSAWLAWQSLRNPEVPFLSRLAPAEWILYPTPPTSSAQPEVEIDAVFRKSFTLERAPAGATLRARFYRQGRVLLNGEPLPLSGAGDWKQSRTADVSLRPGRNEIRVEVVNGFGPPALWLTLEGEGLAVATDGTWEASLAGAVWRPARRATEPMSAWASRPTLDAQPSPLAALRSTFPLLLFFAALAGAGLALARRFLVLPLAVPIVLLWTALFWNNRSLERVWGFDAPAHLEYVRTVLERGHLPLADEGWEMYQPPLYYVAAAGLLKATGHARLDDSGVAILRGLGWAAAVLQTLLVLASLRLLFPDQPRRVAAGLCLGLFLPVQLYMFQYITNEGWAAVLASASIYLTLLILKEDSTSPGRYFALGAVLGLAMLAKFSALLPLAVIVIVLAGRRLVRGERSPRLYARTLGTMLMAFLLVCGWHYARVTAHFGRPLVGNWDRDTGFAWWQDPGYHTSGDFLRFGRSLTKPLLSAFHSVPDALYSTLWGDGMIGGSARLALRPPWSYGLMAAGYLLALLPTLMILLGLGAALVHLLRRPRAEWFLLLGSLGGTAFAVIAMSLRLPFYAQPKAFYGMSAVVPICALGAWGFDLLARRGRLAATLLSVLLGTWAVNAYASFWIPSGRSGPSAEAIASLDPEGLMRRSYAAQNQGRLDEAAALARRATQLSPDDPVAWVQLGTCLGQRGETRKAIGALREALRGAPRDPGLHRELSRLYEGIGERRAALEHRQRADRLEAGSPPAG